LIHPHAQILATPVFPPDSLHRYAVATRYYDDTGHSVFTDLVEQERTSAARIVAVTDEFIVFEPFAARLPFETWIVPLAAEPSFDRLDDDRIPGLAALVRAVLGALRRAAGDPDYNLVLDSAPVLEESKPFYVWHLRLLPRMTTPAGFELATGMSINTVAPEDSARLMREALRGAEVG
jgi:UDPglucose--hexose-1-phosphate uridylyltransferase